MATEKIKGVSLAGRNKRQVTAMKTTTLDAQSTDVFEFNISKPVTVDLITPLFA